MSLVNLAWNRTSVPEQFQSLYLDRRGWAFLKGDKQLNLSPSLGYPHPPNLSPPLYVSSIMGLVSNLVLLSKLQRCQVFLTIPLPSDYPFKQCWLQEIAVVQGGCHNTHWLKPACVIHCLIEVITQRGRADEKPAKCAEGGLFLITWV